MMIIQCSELAYFERAGRCAAHSPRLGTQSTRTLASLLRSRSHRAERSQAREVVRGHGQREQLVDFVQPPDHHLADRPDHLAPTEALLDALALALTDLVA